MTIRILIADDHKLIRDGLVALIGDEDDMMVVAQAENGRQAVELARKHNPDIVVMDINMPDLNGIDAARMIIEENPDARIIALSIHTTGKFIKPMLQAGVKGYLVKHCAFEELSAAIRMVMENQNYLSSQIVGTVINDYAANTNPGDDSVYLKLSTREREVLQMVAEGASSEEISEQLFISVKTVSSHRRRIMKKLNLKSIAEVTRYAINEGLITVD